MTLALNRLKPALLPSSQNLGGAVYRGSFGSMHSNHTRFAEQAIEEGFTPLVITFPHITNPTKKLADPHLRFQLASMMLELLPQDIKQQIHLLEPKEQTDYLTYITAIRHYLNQPTGRLNFVAGGDTIKPTIDPKESPLAILKQDFQPIFYERLPTPINRREVSLLSKEFGASIQIRPTRETKALSSSQIRKGMSDWNIEELSNLYPSHILDFLKEHIREFTQF